MKQDNKILSPLNFHIVLDVSERELGSTNKYQEINKGHYITKRRIVW